MSVGTVVSLPGSGPKGGGRWAGTAITIGATSTVFRRHDGQHMRMRNDELRLDVSRSFAEALRYQVIPGRTAPQFVWRKWTLADHIAYDEHPRIPAPPLVVVGCGARKASTRSRADELYTGSYHQLALRAARALAGPDRIRILSAGRGLLDLHERVEPYDTRLGDPAALTATDVRMQARFRWLLDVAEVVVLAGRDYAALARQVWPHARTPLDGTCGIGQQQQRLARIAAASRCNDPTPVLASLPEAVGPDRQDDLS